MRIDIGDFGNQGIRDNEEGEGIVEHSEENEENKESRDNVVVNSDANTLSQEADIDTEQTQVRHSTRVSKKPSYLDDYICLAEAEGECLLLLLNEEPWDFNKAI